MTKYFIDTEFFEDFHKPLFGKRRHFIDLISIGIVCEDGRSYYAISNEFDLKAVWNKYDLKPDIDNGGIKKVYWLRENVLKPIFEELCDKYNKIINSNVTVNGVKYTGLNFTLSNVKMLIKKYGKSNKQIAEEVEWFIRRNHHVNCNINKLVDDKTHIPVSFYGYYADYDWVLLCSLFGRMIDLPTGFPMICFDIQQLITDHKIDKDKLLKEIPQVNEHNALSDARWNKKLYDFINKL